MHKGMITKTRFLFPTFAVVGCMLAVTMLVVYLPAAIAAKNLWKKLFQAPKNANAVISESLKNMKPQLNRAPLSRRHFE